MSKILSTYTGDGHTRLLHEASGAELITDLPIDNGGQGRGFSPTDLVAGALASCSLSIMSKMAESKNQDFKNTAIEVDKVMAAGPRRIAKLILKIHFPSSIPAEDKPKYLAAVKACPVHNSLAKELEIELTEV